MNKTNWHFGQLLADDLRHAVGDGHRNHYCCSIGSSADKRWAILCGMGLAKRGVVINDGQDVYYHVVEPKPWVSVCGD